ncbi:MAG: hypothetical protein JRI58_11135 [Deltaproteobacteria bacterium]|nr:hypothetical protein [Deltaproteobacteria bacterium]MBW2075278.1 hypothetical protein [Deltaproteobacteria bacterium]
MGLPVSVFEVTGKATPRGEDQGAWLALRKECDLEVIIIVIDHWELCRNY